MYNNSKNLRTCIGCRKRNKKENFLRLSYIFDQSINKNIIKLDLDGKIQARGAWIHNSQICFNYAIKRKSFFLALKIKENATIIENKFLNIFNEI